MSNGRRVAAPAGARRRRGIGLVEVMITIAIIVTLMTVLAIGVYRNYQWSRVETTKLGMSRTAQEIEVYVLRNHRPPPADRGLAAVVGDELPTDSWNRPLEYHTPGPDGAPYALVSLGGDGVEGGTEWDEDIVFTPRR